MEDIILELVRIISSLTDYIESGDENMKEQALRDVYKAQRLLEVAQDTLDQ